MRCTVAASAGRRRRRSSRPPRRRTARWSRGCRTPRTSTPRRRRPRRPRSPRTPAAPRRSPRPRMPELPEVEVVRLGLERHVLHRRIESVEVLHPRPVRRHLAGPDDFAARLTGRTFTAAHRRGKYLWLALAPPDEGPGDALLAHLGMSGQMLVQPPGAPDEKHLRVRFLLGPRVGEPDSPDQTAPRHAESPVPDDLDYPQLELRFVDQRMFGGLAVSEGGAVVP